MRRLAVRFSRGAWCAACGATAMSVMFGASGCAGDKAVAPSVRSPNLTLGTLQVSPLNAILATGETMQIDVVGKALDGGPLATLDSVVYRTQSATDTLRVQVSSSGIVTARAATGSSPVLLNVYVFKDGIARADQVVIQVTGAAIAGAGLSVQPAIGDSTKIARGQSKIITPGIGNVAGDSVQSPQLRYVFRGEDASKVGCYTPQFSDYGNFTSAQLSLTPCGSSAGLNEFRAQSNAGTVWMIADAIVYGQRLRDSVQYTLTNPYEYQISVFPNNLSVGGPTTLMHAEIAPGGTVTFQNSFDPALGTSVDFVFENPAVAEPASSPSTDGGSSGNVIGLNGGTTSARRFLTAGTYEYTATLHGSVPPFAGATVHGSIIVR